MASPNTDVAVGKEPVLAKIETSRSERQIDARNWDLCLAFLEGRQYVFWDKVQSQFINIPQQQLTGRNRITINKLLNGYRSVVSALATSYPSIVVTGETGSYAEITQSEASELALRWFWADQQIEEVFTECAKWLTSVGNVGIYTVWNEETETIETDYVSPYNIFWEPGTGHPKESRWVAIKKLVAREEMIRCYPDFAEQLESVAAETAREQTRPGTGSTQGATTVPENMLAFYEVVFRDGHIEFWVGSSGSGVKVLSRPTPGRCFPFQFVRYTDIPGRLWGLGMMTQALDLQSMYNRSRNLIFDAGELMTNPIWLVPTTTGILQGQISNAPGKTLFYKPAGGKPERVSGSEMPAFFQNSIDKMDAEMMDITGRQATSLGKRPKGITAAKAIEELTHQDDSQLQITAHGMETAAKELAKVVLMFMQEYYTEKKFIKIMGVNGRTIHREIDHQDLIANPMIHIEAGSLFRDEVEDRDQKTMQALQSKLITPEEARARLSMHVGNRDAVKKMQAYAHAEELLDGATGKRDQMVDGQIFHIGIEIWPFDDLQAIHEVFMEFVRSSEYAALGEGRSTYVRDILAAVSLFMAGNTDPNAFDKQVNQKVWPLQPRDPAVAAQEIEGSGNVQAGQQIAGAAQMMADKGQQLQTTNQLVRGNQPTPTQPVGQAGVVQAPVPGETPQ